VIQVFSTDDLKLLYTITSKTHPVGVDAFQEEQNIEVWAVNYVSGLISQP
jgi:hypothetical protein